MDFQRFVNEKSFAIFSSRLSAPFSQVVESPRPSELTLHQTRETPRHCFSQSLSELLSFLVPPTDASRRLSKWNKISSRTNRSATQLMENNLLKPSPVQTINRLEVHELELELDPRQSCSWIDLIEVIVQEDPVSDFDVPPLIVDTSRDRS